MAYDLPRTLTLPSGSRVTVRRATSRPATPTQRAVGAPLFSETIALFERDVELVRQDTRLDVRDLPLADFHVLRAVLTKARLVHEDPVEVDCHNCGEHLSVRPCARLETGPWEDGEADDPELDWTEKQGVSVEIPPVRLGRVRLARTMTLAPRTVGEAEPLFVALARRTLDIDAEIVHAMGITELGGTTDPTSIARSLAECDDDSFGVVTDVFLDAHYPLRLGADVFCSKCRARNQIDAPYVREFERGTLDRRLELGARDDKNQREPFPPLEEFVEIAHAIAEPLIAEIPGEPVSFIVEGDTPEVDDGGEPLLGSYVPPPARDALVPTKPPTVTVYYRTFERESEEIPWFDWKAELVETIEHELEHHVFWLRGDDPMDKEEREEIEREIVRVVGRNEATRRTLATARRSAFDFLRRAWPLIAIAAIALALSMASNRCAGTSFD